MLFTISCLIYQSLGQLKSKTLYTMDNSDHQSCTVTASTDITFMSCNQNAYAYKTSTLLLGDPIETNKTQLNLTNPNLPVSSVRTNNEINKFGSITYFNQSNYKAYRVQLASSGSISLEELFTIDSRVIGNINQVDDILITRDMIIVKFTNSTFYSYNRPQQTTPLTLSTPRAARISYTSVQQLNWQFIQVDTLMQDFYLYSSPNFVTQENRLYQHLIQPRYTNGLVTDVAITQINNFNLKDLQMTAIEFTSGLIAIGCPSCNSYVGRVEIYERNSFTLIRTVYGSSSADNNQMGQVLKAIEYSDNQLTFYIGSSSSGSQTSRQFYLNALQFQKFYTPTSNTTLGFQLISQTVRNIVNLPQNGIFLGMIGNIMILKYMGNKGIFSVLSCSKSNYLTQDNTCQSCPSSDIPFQLSIQAATCSNCATVWYSQRKSQSTTYQDALYDGLCQNFDPKTLPDYYNYTNGNGTGNNGTDNNQTDGGGTKNNNSSSDSSGLPGGAIAGIVIGILALVIILAIGGYCYYKKKRTESDSKEVIEKRQQKQKDKIEKAAAVNNKAGAKNQAQKDKEKERIEEQNKRIQKKMEKELQDKIKADKEIEKKKAAMELEKKKASELEKKKQEAKSAAVSSGKQNKPEGPGDIESQIYSNSKFKSPLDTSNKKFEGNSGIPTGIRPNGEVNDPNDIDVEFSSQSDDFDEADDASEISQERNQPDRINNIQNKQQQPQQQSANVYLSQNAVKSQPQAQQKEQQPSNNHNRNKSEANVVQSAQNSARPVVNQLNPAQIRSTGPSTAANSSQKQNEVKPNQNLISAFNSKQTGKNDLKDSHRNPSESSFSSSDGSRGKLEEKKHMTQPSTDDKSKPLSNPPTVVNQSNINQRKQFKDESAEIIEDDDDSFTDSDDDN
eukprot:403364770